MKLLLLLTTLALTSCGMNHNVRGGTKHKTESTVTIEIILEICDDHRFTPEQKLSCIAMVTNPTVTGKIEASEIVGDIISAGE